MRKRIASRICCILLLVLMVGCAAADPSAEMMDAVRAITAPYYDAAQSVAMNSPHLGRFFTDHRTAHAEMVMVKSLEVGRALQGAAAMGALRGEAADGRVALNGEIDFDALAGAALAHDTGMCGGGYALIETVDENGAAVLLRDEDGKYVLEPEDPDNFAQIRSYHSLTGALYVLTERDAYRAAGYTDLQIDRMAIAVAAHSKSTSGVRDLNSKANWADCFDRLDALVAAWNAEHDDPIFFDRTPFESDDVLMGAVASETLALRVGDVSRDSGPGAIVQSGEVIVVKTDTVNSYGGSIEAEVENAVVVAGEEEAPVPDLKSRQIHVGEQNISFNRTFLEPDGTVAHEITVVNGCLGPRSTQQGVEDHLGEFCSARDEQFTVYVIFTSFEDNEEGFFRNSWEEFRIRAAQDYPTIEIVYPWDEEVSE